MAKGREIPFWRTFVGTFGFFFSSKCLGRIGFWQTLLFLVILLVVAEEISEYMAVLNDNFLNFGVSTTPTLVIVDRDGIVQRYNPGDLSHEELAGLIKPLLD